MTISTTQFETYTVNGDQVPLDLIIWRRYRSMTPGLVEATYDKNKGLAYDGRKMSLPHGEVVSIPIDTTPIKAPIAIPKITLF